MPPSRLRGSSLQQLTFSVGPSRDSSRSTTLGARKMKSPTRRRRDPPSDPPSTALPLPSPRQSGRAGNAAVPPTSSIWSLSPSPGPSPPHSSIVRSFTPTPSRPGRTPWPTPRRPGTLPRRRTSPTTRSKPNGRGRWRHTVPRRPHRRMEAVTRRTRTATEARRPCRSLLPLRLRFTFRPYPRHQAQCPLCTPNGIVTAATAKRMRMTKTTTTTPTAPSTAVTPRRPGTSGRGEGGSSTRT
mmetsp:Transcript_19286/g.56272  ORF Transcript_19286/g.56272 Transcript_19286/m.56272 type:complete len:241 (+) Transcript_19286:1954-2676(+)